jgi:hypothetical protein
MARPNTGTRQDFGHVLDARERSGREADHFSRHSRNTAPVAQIHEVLSSIAPSWREGSPTPRTEAADLYEEADLHLGKLVSMPAAEMVARELGLSPGMTADELNRVRRDFALSNHPDRVDPALREVATQRMMIANALIDGAVKNGRARP